MTKSCPARKVGHTRSRVNFKELLKYQKKLTEPTELAHALFFSP